MREAISTSIAFSRIQLQQRRSYICEAQLSLRSGATPA